MSGVRADLRRAWRRSARWRPTTMTAGLVWLTAIFYVLQLASNGALQRALEYRPCYSVAASDVCREALGPGAHFEPWRMLTSALLHQPVVLPDGLLGLTHIVFNMIALWLFGRPLEEAIGPLRLLVIYVLGALAGSEGVLYAALTGLMPMNTVVYGASGAVFAVLGAVAAVQRRLGIDVRSLAVLIVINLALGFVVPGIAWQAHVGGLIAGAVIGWIFISNRGPRRDRRAAVIVSGVGAVLVVLAAVPSLAA